MSFDSPAPEVLVMLKARVLASAVLAALWPATLPETLADTLGIHYPDYDVTTGDLPAVVLAEENYEVDRSAHGEWDDTETPNSASLVFHFDPDEVPVGTIERAMGELCQELVSWTTEGLAIKKAKKTRATKPARSAEAAADDEDGKLFCKIAVVVFY